MDFAFWVAVAAALSGALAGNRTAWVLLASMALTFAAEWAGMRFHPVSWIAIDFIVILLILRPNMKITDALIIALFVPAWALYTNVVPEQPRYELVNLIVMAQLLLTFPARKALLLLKRSDDAGDRDRDQRA